MKTYLKSWAKSYCSIILLILSTVKFYLVLTILFWMAVLCLFSSTLCIHWVNSQINITHFHGYKEKNGGTVHKICFLIKITSIWITPLLIFIVTFCHNVRNACKQFNSNMLIFIQIQKNTEILCINTNLCLITFLATCYNLNKDYQSNKENKYHKSNQPIHFFCPEKLHGRSRYGHHLGSSCMNAT